MTKTTVTLKSTNLRIDELTARIEAIEEKQAETVRREAHERGVVAVVALIIAIGGAIAFCL